MGCCNSELSAHEMRVKRSKALDSMQREGFVVDRKLNPEHIKCILDEPPHTKVIARNRPRYNFKARDFDNNEALANACTNAVA